MTQLERNGDSCIYWWIKIISDKKQYQNYTFHHCIEAREGPMILAYTQIYSWGDLINRGPTRTTEAPPALPKLWGSGEDGHPTGWLPPTAQLEEAGLACRILIFSPPHSLKRILPSVSLLPALPTTPPSAQSQVWTMPLCLLLPGAEGSHARE